MKLSEHVGSTSRLTDTAIYKKITHILDKIFAAITGIKNNSHVSSTTLSRPEGQKTGQLNPFTSIVSVREYDADKAGTTTSPADHGASSTPATKTPQEIQDNKAQDALTVPDDANTTDTTSTAATENDSVNNAAVNKPLKSILKKSAPVLNKIDISTINTHGDKKNLVMLDQMKVTQLQEYIATSMVEIGGVSSVKPAVEFTITGTDQAGKAVMITLGFQPKMSRLPDKSGKVETKHQFDVGRQFDMLEKQLPALQRRQDAGTVITAGKIEMKFNNREHITGIAQEKTLDIKGVRVAVLTEYIERHMNQIGGISVSLQQEQGKDIFSVLKEKIAHYMKNSAAPNVPQGPSLVTFMIEESAINNENQEEKTSQTIHFIPKYQEAHIKRRFQRMNDNTWNKLARDANSEFSQGIQQQLENLQNDLVKW